MTPAIAARETSAMALCVSSLFGHPKSTSSADPPKSARLSLGSLQPNAVARCAPSMPSRKQPVAQEPCGSVQLVLTDAEGTSESHSSGRPLPSRWSPRPSSSVVSMRWTRGLQTEVLEHMPPCSAPRWLLIACTLVFAQRTRISQVSQSDAVPWPVGFSGKEEADGAASET